MKSCAIFSIASAVILFGNGASAQFTPALLQNGSYWGDGKSEIDLYDAQIMREGQPRHCEVTLILGRDTFTPQITVSSTPQPKAEAVTGLRLSQMVTVPVGLSAEQQSLSMFWDLAGHLLEGSLVATTGKGNRITSVEDVPDVHSLWTEVRNERGECTGMNFIVKNGSSILYDELPVRVRTIDFSKAAAKFEFQMGPSLLNPDSFKKASASYKINERAIEVEIREEGALDRFVLDRDFPFLLREWKMRDGSLLKLKNSLKAEARNYTKNGDRERALKDPMLRHPD